MSNKNTKRLKKERSVDEAKTKIVNQIIEQIKEILKDPIEKGECTNGSQDTIREIFRPILNEFKDLTGENKDKK